MITQKMKYALKALLVLGDEAGRETPEPLTVARLLQARGHLRAAAATLHPARWQAFYAPQLRILEEDILPRFAERELAAAESLLSQLPPLPDLR